MTKPNKPLVEVDTEDDYSTDTRSIRISVDIGFAAFVIALMMLVCGGGVLLLIQR